LAASALVGLLLGSAAAQSQDAAEIAVGASAVTEDHLPEARTRIGGVTVRTDIAYWCCHVWTAPLALLF
jgi:hypothetical protein